MLARYNKAATTLGRKVVRKFADSKTALRRVAAIEAELPRVTQGKTPPRENSMRAKLLDVVRAAGKRGIAVETLHKHCGFKNLKSTRDALGLLNRNNGYGIVTEDSKIRLVK